MSTEKQKFYQSHRWRKLRQKIFERDSGLCAECGRKGYTTEAELIHHIKPWASAKGKERERLKWAEDNLEPVCHKCHGYLHRQLYRANKEASKIYQMALGLLKDGKG